MLTTLENYNFYSSKSILNNYPTYPEVLIARRMHCEAAMRERERIDVRKTKRK